MANILMPDHLVKLNNLLQAIENAPVECDGHTLMISSALNHAGISHQRMCGVVKNPKTDFELYPHFWIEIGEFTLDYRLRMWVELYSGEKLSEGAPHGIFDARGVEYLYTSGSICPPPAMARVLTSKYAEHTPLYRQTEIYGRQGVELSRSLLSG